MTTNKTVYELGYLLTSDLTETEAGAGVTELKELVAKQGGVVTTAGETHFIDLAYEMVKKIKSKNHKFDQAYFGWIKFTAEAETPAKIEKALKEVDSLLRAIVVKTVEDDSVTDLFVSEDAAVDETPVDEGVDMGDEDVEKSPAPKKETTTDDLTKVEGIGPKIAETLVSAGVATFKDLSSKTSEEITEIITDVRGSHDAETWPKQAEMAAEGKWDELKTWQDEMDGGKA